MENKQSSLNTYNHIIIKPCTTNFKGIVENIFFNLYLIPLSFLLLIISVCVAGVIPMQCIKCIPKLYLRKENSSSGAKAEPIRKQQNVGPFFIYRGQRKEHFRKNEMPKYLNCVNDKGQDVQ